MEIIEQKDGLQDDGSDIASLMSCFTKKAVNNPKFPVFTQRMDDLKNSERGQTAVCAVMEMYENKAREEGKLELLKQLVTDGLMSQEVAKTQEALIKRSAASLAESVVEYHPE